MTTHGDMPMIVAGEVRAHLARRRLSGRQAALRLGWTQPYMSRRLTGDVPFDVSDLAALADLLEVPIEDFFSAPRHGPTVGRPTVPSLPVYSRSAFRSPFPVGLVA